MQGMNTRATASVERVPAQDAILESSPSPDADNADIEAAFGLLSLSRPVQPTVNPVERSPLRHADGTPPPTDAAPALTPPPSLQVPQSDRSQGILPSSPVSGFNSTGVNPASATPVSLPVPASESNAAATGALPQASPHVIAVSPHLAAGATPPATPGLLASSTAAAATGIYHTPSAVLPSSPAAKLLPPPSPSLLTPQPAAAATPPSSLAESILTTPIGDTGKSSDAVDSLAEQLSGAHLGVIPGLTPPSLPREKDARVGLIYDEAMELHVGPESKHLNTPLPIPLPCARWSANVRWILHPGHQSIEPYTF